MLENIDPEIFYDFVIEAETNLDQASNDLIKLENDLSNLTYIDTIFRTFHSIKGSSSFFDLLSVKKVAHKSENLLAEIKSKKRRCTPHVVSTLLSAIDLIKKLLKESASTKQNRELTDDEKTILTLIQTIIESEAEVETIEVFQSEIKANTAVQDSSSLKKTMRISEETVDSFMQFTGELISISEMFGHLQGRLDSEKIEQALKRDFKNAIATFQSLSSDLRKSIMEIRKIPIKTLFSKYPKMCRDLAHTLNKDVELTLVGEELLIDKSLIEILEDPMVHIVRNSVDHGIETREVRIQKNKSPKGKIEICATSNTSFLILTITDDGKGLDSSIIKKKALERGLTTETEVSKMSEREINSFIFAPGFSLAEKVTDVSGRGVGMDVVLTNIRNANGSIEIESKLGQGTTLTIKLPLTVSTQITKGLIVGALAEKLIVPIENLKSVLKVQNEHLLSLHSQHDALLFRGVPIPLLHLAQLLEFSSESTQNDSEKTVVVLEHQKVLAGVIIDSLHGVQQIAIKETGEIFKSNPFLSGGAILRDGRVGLVLNVKTLCNYEEGRRALSSH